MTWSELFQIIEVLNHHYYNENIKSFPNIYGKIKSFSNDYGKIDFFTNNEHAGIYIKKPNTISSVLRLYYKNINDIFLLSSDRVIRIIDYKQYTDDIEATLILGRVPDYSIVKDILRGRNDLA